MGSAFNKIIYTIIKEASAFSPVAGSANGCTWNIRFEDDFTEIIRIPLEYEGTDECLYDPGTLGVENPGEYGDIENPNDAIQLAVLALLRKLDVNHNGKIDVLFTEQGLEISLVDVSGIPYGYTIEVQARTWKKGAI